MNVFSKKECLQIVEAHKREIKNIFFYEKQFQILAICIDNSISVWDYRNFSKIEFLKNEEFENQSKMTKFGLFIKQKELLITLNSGIEVISF